MYTADVGAGPVPARTPVTAFVSAYNHAAHWPHASFAAVLTSLEERISQAIDSRFAKR